MPSSDLDRLCEIYGDIPFQSLALLTVAPFALDGLRLGFGSIGLLQ